MIGIYGANGFIGRHLVRRLAERRVALKAVSRKFDPEFAGRFEDNVEFVSADLRDQLDMSSSLQDIDVVIQLISNSSPSLGNDHIVEDIRDNVIPHLEFMQTCCRMGVKRYIFISSGGTVYGPSAPLPTPETSPTNPINSHGLTKLMVEKYIEMHGVIDKLEYFILRVANPYGPGQLFKKGQGLIPAILERWYHERPVRIYGQGETRRDYVYIEDVIDAIEAAVACQGSPREILNIGSGESHSVNDVVTIIENLTAHTFKRENLEARATDVDNSMLDIGRAAKVLGWRPRTEFETGMERTIKAYESSRLSRT